MAVRLQKGSDGNTWIVHETGLTLTSRLNTEELAFIDGDYQLVTQMLKVTKADKFHFVDG
jgi:hypothetical protein